MELIRGGKVVARLLPASEAKAPNSQEALEAWNNLPHLAEDEADAFAEDIASARKALNSIPESRWD